MPIFSRRSLRAALATLFVPLALAAGVVPDAALAATMSKAAAETRSVR